MTDDDSPTEINETVLKPFLIVPHEKKRPQSKPSDKGTLTMLGGVNQLVFSLEFNKIVWDKVKVSEITEDGDTKTKISLLENISIRVSETKKKDKSGNIYTSYEMIPVFANLTKSNFQTIGKMLIDTGRDQILEFVQRKVAGGDFENFITDFCNLKIGGDLKKSEERLLKYATAIKEAVEYIEEQEMITEPTWYPTYKSLLETIKIDKVLETVISIWYASVRMLKEELGQKEKKYDLCKITIDGMYMGRDPNKKENVTLSQVIVQKHVDLLSTAERAETLEKLKNIQRQMSDVAKNLSEGDRQEFKKRIKLLEKKKQYNQNEYGKDVIQNMINNVNELNTLEEECSQKFPFNVIRTKGQDDKCTNVTTILAPFFQTYVKDFQEGIKSMTGHQSIESKKKTVSKKKFTHRDFFNLLYIPL